MHSHEHAGQTLRHAHPGGDKPHGYFEHPEDAPPGALAAAVGDIADRLLSAEEHLAVDHVILRRVWLLAGGWLDRARRVDADAAVQRATALLAAEVRAAFDVEFEEAKAENAATINRLDGAGEGVAALEVNEHGYPTGNYVTTQEEADPDG